MQGQDSGSQKDRRPYSKRTTTAPARGRLLRVARIEGVLLDIDGVLAVSWEPVPGAARTVTWLRNQGVPFRLVTNTTTHTAADLADVLTGAGIPVQPWEVITAVVGTASYLRRHHTGARCYLLTDGNALDDLEGIHLVEPDAEDADVVVLGGACDEFSYSNVNRAFRMLMSGASLIAMHKNLYWRTSAGWELDGGAYVRALEEAAGVTATVCGKPSAPFFEAALGMLGMGADRVCMVGDDIVNDVLGAQDLGLTGVLVRTGKFRPEDVEKGAPDLAIDSIADLPALLGAA